MSETGFEVKLTESVFRFLTRAINVILEPQQSGYVALTDLRFLDSRWCNETTTGEAVRRLAMRRLGQPGLLTDMHVSNCLKRRAATETHTVA